jgi:acyl-CoA thioester hydrolase
MRTYSLTLRVRYGETDQMGVVYHANYLHYFEMGRTELMREAGVAYRELEARGIYLVVTESAIRHRAPARYDEELRVVTTVDRVGRATVRFRYEIHGPAGTLLAEGHTELASVDASKKPVRLPEEIASRLGGLSGR